VVSVTPRPLFARAVNFGERECMSSATDEAEQILSQDVQGRVLTPRESREPIVGEYDRNGMSEVKSAQYVGIKYSTLGVYWLDGAVLNPRHAPFLLHN